MERRSSFACRSGGPIMKGVTYWLRLCPSFSLTIRLRCFVQKVVVSFFVWQLHIIVYLLCCRFLRLHLLVDRLIISCTQGCHSSCLIGYFASLTGRCAHICGWCRIIFILQGWQFDLNEASLPYHRSCEVDWEDKDSVGWFQYDSARGNVFDIHGLESTTCKRTVSNAQFKR